MAVVLQPSGPSTELPSSEGTSEYLRSSPVTAANALQQQTHYSWEQVTPKPTPTPEPTPAPTPEPTPEPTPTPEPPPPLTDVEAVVCSAGWPDCNKALRVARCESGLRVQPFNGWHVGPFQLSQDHVAKFAAHGWDYYSDGVDLYKNSVIALEIYSQQGWEPWPYCGYR